MKVAHPTVVAKYRLLRILNWRTLYYGRLVEPVVYYLLLLTGLADIIDQVTWRSVSIDYSQYAFVGVLGLMMVRWATILMTDVANDRKWGVYAFARMQGSTGIGYIIGSVIGAFPLILAQLVLLSLAAVTMSDVPIGIVLLLAAAYPLLVTVWLLVGVGVGLAVTSYHRRDLILSLTILPIAFSAPLFWSLDQTEGYLAALATVNPLTYAVAILRGVAHGQAQMRVADFLIVALFGLVALAAIRLGLRREWLVVEAG